MEGINWSPIHSNMREELEKPFTEDEIKNAVFQCDGNKTLGPDGFALLLYQECWDIIKGDLMRVFEEFFEGGVVNGIMNETYICLIPKKNDLLKIKDYRPISLVTSLYKVRAKVLSIRLKSVLSHTIAETHCAFVKGRHS